MKILKDIMPKKFLNAQYYRTKAYKMKDIEVVKEHFAIYDQDDFKQWPGKQKNIRLWVELENGFAVGFNENPDNGWSFPVLKIKE